MNREPASYIVEYYDSIKDKYPNLTYSQADEICRSNFKMIKAEMQKGSLRNVRLRYFGLFLVYKSRAIGLLNKTEKMFKSEKVSVEIRNYIKKIVKQYLKREYNEDIPS